MENTQAAILSTSSCTHDRATLRMTHYEAYTALESYIDTFEDDVTDFQQRQHEEENNERFALPPYLHEERRQRNLCLEDAFQPGPHHHQIYDCREEASSWYSLIRWWWGPGFEGRMHSLHNTNIPSWGSLQVSIRGKNGEETTLTRWVPSQVFSFGTPVANVWKWSLFLDLG